MASFEDSGPEVIFFLGAGASVRAGISGVQCMVKDFLEKLKREYSNSHFQIANDIFTFVFVASNNSNEQGTVPAPQASGAGIDRTRGDDSEKFEVENDDLPEEQDTTNANNPSSTTNLVFEYIDNASVVGQPKHVFAPASYSLGLNNESSTGTNASLGNASSLLPLFKSGKVKVSKIRNDADSLYLFLGHVM
jgi:hypothetical protein